MVTRLSVVLINLDRDYTINRCTCCSPPIKTLECEKKCARFYDNIEMVLETIFRKVMGCLIYLSNTKRADITYAVNLVIRKQSNPQISIRRNVGFWDIVGKKRE